MYLIGLHFDMIRDSPIGCSLDVAPSGTSSKFKNQEWMSWKRKMCISLQTKQEIMTSESTMPLSSHLYCWCESFPPSILLITLFSMEQHESCYSLHQLKSVVILLFCDFIYIQIHLASLVLADLFAVLIAALALHISYYAHLHSPRLCLSCIPINLEFPL